MNKKQQKSPVSLRLPDELQKYLSDRANAGYRNMSQEILMRLEASRQADQQTTQQKGHPQ
jgi:hypothetical protein